MKIVSPINHITSMLTQIVKPYFALIDNSMLKAASHTEQSQRHTLRFLVSQGSKTLWGIEHGFKTSMSYEQWRDKCPLVSYEDIRPMVMKMIAGERDILWPGIVKRYAQSSGTSGGKNKFIPITPRCLSHCHYRGATDAVAHYLSEWPDSRLFDGRALILGGSFANELDITDRRVKVGDLSAHLIECVNPLVAILRVPSRDTALMADWHAKLPRLVEETIKRNVTNLSGVPSWMMTVLKEALRVTGASTVHEIWPNLEVFFHGGISFDPYRQEYKRLVGDDSMRYFENYNASEGFFAMQYKRNDSAMLLLMDVDTFYEFIPVDGGDPVPAWGVKAGEVYELVITSSNGLWRYRIGDTVKVHGTDPVTITIAGRTQHYINAFGEELMVYNADAAIKRACDETGASVANYTAAPVYATCGTRGRHEWLIEWERRPTDIDDFAHRLDDALRSVNGDYDAKRKGDIFLSPLTIVTLPTGTFDRWLESTGRLGGQRKIPRLYPDRRYADALSEFAKNN